jgi:cell division protein FtsL
MSNGAGDNKVQLGCGTLIVIAIIVMMFSGGRDSSRLRSEIQQLNQKIDRLETKIDSLSKNVVGSSSERGPG